MRAPATPRPVVVAVAALLLLTAVVAFRWGAGERAVPPVASAAPQPSPTEQLTIAEVYATLAASVVTIEAVDPATKRVSAIGTGVVASTAGVIVTALHVVQGDASIRVTFADGTASAATLVSADPTTDIAAIAPQALPTVLVPAVIGSSSRLAVGDTVIAIGNQLGLASSATAGVVSGLNRAATGTNGVQLAGLIQFDAAVNPGSSGGPLVNAKGETIGIVVALANPTDTGTFIGIGFAVPIGVAVAAGGGDAPQQ